MENDTAIIDVAQKTATLRYFVRAIMPTKLTDTLKGEFPFHGLCSDATGLDFKVTDPGKMETWRDDTGTCRQRLFVL